MILSEITIEQQTERTMDKNEWIPTVKLKHIYFWNKIIWLDLIRIFDIYVRILITSMQMKKENIVKKTKHFW